MPHTIPAAAQAKKVVVIGAGPGGLEAARVAAERGHDVVLFEAADQPGGQVRLLARSRRRSDLIGIIDWRVAELERLGVDMRFNALADAEDVLAEAPDIVVVATGGVPDTDVCQGADLVTSSWDILSGDAKPGAEVLVFDDHGQDQGLQAAEALAGAGAKVEIVTPERTLGVDIAGSVYPGYARELVAHDVAVTLNTRLTGVRRAGNRLVASLGSDYADRTWDREVDQVVVEHGTLPVDDLYFELKPLSRNLGEVDQPALMAGKAQALESNPQGQFLLFRIGDAVASRNIHAAIYDGLRYAKDF